MTLLKSRLVTPDGKPIVGRRVTATLMSRPSWIESPNNGGRALGTVTAYTQSGPPLEEDPASKAGLWEMDLLPVDQFEGGGQEPYVWYQVDEGEGAVWAVRFDDSQKEVWLKDRLIDPPKPEPEWQAIDKLGSLHDVDRDSVNDAPEGSVLVKRDGIWRAELPRLETLSDIDEPSVTWAEYEDELINLGEHRWGTKRFVPINVTFGLVDPSNPYELWFEGVQYTPGYEVEYQITPGMDTYVRWGDPSTRLTYTFPAAGSYLVQVRYLGIENPEGTAWGQSITIPFEEAR